jgi:ribonuclease P protein subunit POP4
MKITPENLIAHELIGLEARVVESSDPSYLNLNGKIVYETRNMLFLQTDMKTKMIPKNINKFLFKLPDDSQCLINGLDLVGRPEDRIQRLS